MILFDICSFCQRLEILTIQFDFFELINLGKIALDVQLGLLILN